MSYESSGLGVGDYVYDESKLPGMIARLKAGDETVIAELVESYIPLARKLALKFTRRMMTQASDTGYVNDLDFREELYAVALSSLFLAIKAAATKLVDDNLTTYVYGWVLRAVMRSHWQQRNPLSWDTVNRKGRKNRELVRHDIKDGDIIIDPVPVAELYQTILDLTQTAKEREILALLMDGCSVKEIAEHTGYSMSHVSRFRSTLYERYMNYVNDPVRQGSRSATEVSPPAERGSLHASRLTGSPT